MHCGLLILLVAFAPPISGGNSGWNSAPDTQFHIQTDEGPERYFKYQTISGQYRKEKRLEDGTVIGSYGWVDANGYLRLRDYIADNQGYRILKTKNVFVGKNRPVSDAVGAAKKITPSAGVLVTPSRTVPQTPAYVTQKYLEPTTNLPPIAEYPRLPPIAEYPSNTYSTTESPIVYTNTESTPYVEILPNSIQTNTERTNHTDVQQPSSTYEPPYLSSSYDKPSTVYIPSTYKPPVAPVISTNDLEYNPEPEYRPRFKTRFQNGPTYPIDRNGQVYTGNGYDPQYPYYDGVSVTNDGFRYYLPRQYHEEQSLPGDLRSGSFGYIDPFGIRRVIYYNTAPGTGFQHKKNNRYVGFHATPYDPRPYR